VITDRTLKVRYIAGIPRSAGSAALSHLRLAGIAALGVAVVTALSALALSLLDDDRPAGRASDQIEGVVTFDVALEGDFSRPPSGPTLAGQVVDVPEGGKTVVLAAPPDHEYQIRFRSGQRWGPWVTVEAGGDDGPDGPAATDGSGPAPSAEGPPPGVVAIGPLLVDGGADRLEVVRLTKLIA
jgi:hypothetical protein